MYEALASSSCFATSPVGPIDAPESVTVNAAMIPSPTIPGLQAVWYVPGGTWTTRSRVSPGPMFSTSDTIRSLSSPRT